MTVRGALPTKSEELAQWYFRLNGFLTLPNFVLHPSSPGSQRTDADVIGVRFPFRREFGSHEIDEPGFRKHSSTPYFVLAEVKSGWVGPNRAWRDSTKSNIEDILAAVGPFDSEENKVAAEQLRSHGVYQGRGLYCSLFFIGEQLDESATGFEKVPHRTWNDVLSFIYKRFTEFAPLKTQTDQWDETGRKLSNLATRYRRDESEFLSAARKAFKLPTA
jgi:hypothetical protein